MEKMDLKKLELPLSEEKFNKLSNAIEVEFSGKKLKELVYAWKDVRKIFEDKVNKEDRLI